MTRDHRSLTVRPGNLASEISFVVRFIWTHPGNRGRRLRKLVEALIFQVKGRLFRRPVIAKIGDRSGIWVHRGVYSASRGLYANPPDWPEMLVWQSVLGPGDLFVDVGANIGIYTIIALEREAEVIAVEPGQPAVEMLKENLALNGYQAEVLPIALGDRPGTMRFTVGLDMSDHLVMDMSDLPTREVEVKTLDDVLGDRFAAGVKIDVEGAEALVVAGAGRALAEHRIGLIQIEWTEASLSLLGQDRTLIAKSLGAHGYELLRPDADGVLVPISNWGFGTDVFARPRH